MFDRGLNTLCRQSTGLLLLVWKVLIKWQDPRKIVEFSFLRKLRPCMGRFIYIYKWKQKLLGIISIANHAYFLFCPAGIWKRSFYQKQPPKLFCKKKFAKFLRIPILESICERLLLFCTGGIWCNLYQEG